MEWISVQDDLPKDMNRVIVCLEFKCKKGFDTGDINFGWFHPVRKQWSTSYEVDNVAYWMPLPDLPHSRVPRVAENPKTEPHRP